MAMISLKIGAWALLLAAIVFWPAGTVFYPGGILFIALFALCGFLFSAWLYKTNPELLHKRFGSPVQPGQKLWDRVFLFLFMIAYMAWIAFMGWDAARTQFSALPGALTVVGVILFALFGIGCWWTFSVNSFAAPVVNIQEGHRLIDTGPYATVRHPMYTSALLLFIAQPLILGSWRGLLFAPIFILGIAGRAVPEEEFLREKLPGYADYMERVRYRLIPGLW